MPSLLAAENSMLCYLVALYTMVLRCVIVSKPPRHANGPRCGGQRGTAPLRFAAPALRFERISREAPRAWQLAEESGQGTATTPATRPLPGLPRGPGVRGPRWCAGQR